MALTDYNFYTQSCQHQVNAHRRSYSRPDPQEGQSATVSGLQAVSKRQSAAQNVSIS